MLNFWKPEPQYAYKRYAYKKHVSKSYNITVRNKVINAYHFIVSLKHFTQTQLVPNVQHT